MERMHFPALLYNHKVTNGLFSVTACVLCLIIISNLPSFGTLLWQHIRQVSLNRGLIFWQDVVEPKYPLARPNKPGMPLAHTKKVLLGVNCTQIWPSEHDILPISGE